MTKDNKIDLTYRILKAISIAGALPLLFIVPNLAKTISPILKSRQVKYDNKTAKNRISSTICRLRNRGLIKNDTKGRLVLTEKGVATLSKYKLTELMKKPKRWDKKWRMVAFDVWEERRKTRDHLRRTLRRLGFVQLQASLWVYPYDCEEVVGLLRTDLKLSPAIQYMIVEKIDRDNWLKEHFGLL